MTNQSTPESDELAALAELIHRRNRTEIEITRIINRPAQIGHIGEFIASKVFDVELCESAVEKGIDGAFRSGPLAGKTVNVKFYGKREGLLDINPDGIPDYYLVLCGPTTTEMRSVGKTRPWVITSVYLFDGPALVEKLKVRGVKLGVATSVAKVYWDDAEWYPRPAPGIPALNSGQSAMLKLFAPQD